MKTAITITLDLEVLKKIKQIAESEQRSTSTCINYILAQAIKRLKGPLFPPESKHI